jgi:hypothetical protein
MLNERTPGISLWGKSGNGRAANGMRADRAARLQPQFVTTCLKRFMIPTSMEFLGLLSLALFQPPATSGPDLHNHAALLAEVQTLSKSYPDQVQIFELGTARSGRTIPGLRITAGPEVDAAQPAILLVAGLDGPRAYTTSMALEHARALAAGFATDDAHKEFLQTTTVYVVPRLDVDAGELRFGTPLAESNATGFGVDNDRDGSEGEDAPADVDGDGFITVMRQMHPEGTWVEDPTDPRVLRERNAEKGELGKWRILPEGLDADGDEEVAEDGWPDCVINRNFPRNWTEHSAEAGRYPTHEPSSLAMVEFLLEHRDIALVVTYGDEFNLAEKPQSQSDERGGTRGSVKTGIYESDLVAYKALGERYRTITENETPGVGEQPGSLQGFVYHHRGLMTLNIDPWSVPLDAKVPTEEKGTEEEEAEDATEEAGAAEPEDEAPKKDAAKPTDDAKRMIWFDQHSPGARLPWSPFDHPQLGAVEIGGFQPYALVEPPAQLREELTAKHLEFFLGLGAILPRVRLVEVEGRSLGQGLVEVNAVLVNDALLPLQSQAAIRSRAIRPARVNLRLPDGAELVAGASQQLVSDLEALGGRREFRWLVAGATGTNPIRIEVSTDNAGNASVQVEVK